MSGNYRISTFDPFPYAGEVHSSDNYNWFNADTIDDVCGDAAGRAVSKPGGWADLFNKIDPDMRGNPREWPTVSFGDYRLDSKSNVKLGTYWTMPGDSGAMLNCDQAMKAITGPIYSKADGWTKDNKGFMVEYLGWYAAKVMDSSSWYQKWNWQIYNTSNQRLANPVKGIAFEFRSPTEEGMIASNDSVPGLSGTSTMDPRGDQTAIDYIWGLWWDPWEGKYFCYEMTEWGCTHAPSMDPSLKGKSPFYSPYWFARRPQDEKGGVIKDTNKVRHSTFKGDKVPIMCWSNERRLEHCHFCGFAVQNETEQKATTTKGHTNQWGKLSPIPFHIDRNTPGARVVFGGFTSGTDYPLRTTST